ncbi:hypothetical protein ACOSP7_027377 [Xanthoceras sorbifolium]
MQNLKKGSLTISDYILKMRSYADHLLSAGHFVSDQDVIMNVLHGLGLEYDSVIVHITSRQDEITLSEAKYLLMTQEQRLEQYHSSIDLSQATENYVSNDKRSQRGSNNSGRGNNISGRGRGYGKSKIMCQLCGKTGHIVSSCYKRFDQQFQGLSIQQTQGHNQNQNQQNSSQNSGHQTGQQ